MKKSKFSEAQILNVIKEYQQGKTVSSICRELGVDKSTFYYWKKKYGDMDRKELKRLKALEEENQKLKQMYADVSLDLKMVKDLLSKKF